MVFSKQFFNPIQAEQILPRSRLTPAGIPKRLRSFSGKHSPVQPQFKIPFSSTVNRPTFVPLQPIFSLNRLGWRTLRQAALGLAGVILGSSAQALDSVLVF